METNLYYSICCMRTAAYSIIEMDQLLNSSIYGCKSRQTKAIIHLYLGTDYGARESRGHLVMRPPRGGISIILQDTNDALIHKIEDER